MTRSRRWSTCARRAGATTILVLAATLAVANVAAPPAAGNQAAGSLLTVDDLPLGLPADVDAAAAILAAEDRRALTDDVLSATRSEVVEVRARAALALGRVGLPSAYPRLLEMLRDPHPAVRALAAFGVGLLELDLEPATEVANRTRIAERLVPLLQDAEPVVVTQALWALGRQGAPLATAAVVAVLAERSRSSAVVGAALDAWWRLPGASPEPVAPYLGSADPATRHAAATSLRRLDDPGALPFLAAALNDTDAAVRAAAIAGMHSAPLTVVREHLLPALEDDDWRVVSAALAWATDLWRRDAEVEDEVFTAVLKASLTRNRYVQQFALEAMASAPGKFSVPEDRLIVALRSGDPATRTAAVVAIASGDGNAADDALDDLREVYGIQAPPRESSASEIPAMLADSPLEAAAVVRALAAAEADDGWLLLLGDHGPSAARAEVLRHLERTEPEQAAQSAARILQEGPPVLQAVASEVVERLWARGLGGLTSFAGPTEWTGLLWDGQRELGRIYSLEPRLSLLEALLLLDPETLRARAQVLLSDTDRVVRIWALRNLRPPAGSRGAELIEGALGPQDTGRTDEDYRLQAQRLQALQLRPPRFEVRTPRGSFVWELHPAWAPLAAAAYLEWVESAFFADLVFHRVVPDFVIQAGDPTAVGSGGAPGSLRSEETPIPYVTGVVGLALAGRDTGGSQFFIVQSPQPHLTGAYPALGRVVEQAHILDRIQPGDRLEMRLQ